MPIIVFFVKVAALSAQWLLTPTFLAHCDAVWGGRQPPHLNAVDPQAWLADILTRLVNGWPMSKIDELMPWADAAGLKECAVA
jgi:hypothetical protein